MPCALSERGAVWKPNWCPAEGFPIEWIEIGGLKRVGLRKTLVTLAELPFSVWTASRMLDRDRPAAVFSMGGFVAGPVLLAALWKRVPVVVMEPNAIPGFTHRKLARFVARALVSFPEAARWFPAAVTEVTGLPVREEFFAIPPKPRGGPADGADHRRQPGLADAESRRAGELAAVAESTPCG